MRGTSDQSDSCGRKSEVQRSRSAPAPVFVALTLKSIQECPNVKNNLSSCLKRTKAYVHQCVAAFIFPTL